MVGPRGWDADGTSRYLWLMHPSKTIRIRPEGMAPRREGMTRALVTLFRRRDVSDDELRAAIARLGCRTASQQTKFITLYRAAIKRPDVIPGDLAKQREWGAAAGSVGDGFRSEYERRLAKSLTRLDIRWTYEPEWFTYADGTGRRRRYTPDFRMDDLSRTFVEVKGPRGADDGDDWKMRRVLTEYPGLTLLLWDATVIEFIEDVTDPAVVLQLLTTTRLAA